jgi:GntR family transcriptional regulator/MocR family aminotransferase
MVKRAEGALLQAISIDRGTRHTLGTQISASLRNLILSGVMTAGERMPASRTLAQELGVARTTIVEAYERLVAEGILEARVGAGTFVSDALNAERPAAVAASPPRPVKSVRLSKAMADASGRFATRLSHEPRPFTTAMPGFDAFPMAQWARLSSKHWRADRHQVLGYARPQGLQSLRYAIASHLRAYRGIDCVWQQIFIVAGAQQAFQLIAATLIDAGDKVWFENPGAIGARNSLILSGADLVPVPVDDNGLDVDAGLARSSNFRLAFVTPSHQQPLGAKMSLERRLALLKAAEDCGAWIIEDDWDGEFCFSGRPMPTLKGIDVAGRVIYVGTFSKSLFPALRLGFLLAPEALVASFHTSLEAFSPGVPTISQAIVSDFITEGHFATHIRRMRKLYAERYQALLDCSAARLGDWLELVPTNTGMHTVAFTRNGLDADRISTVMADRGITMTPLSRFCIEPIRQQGVVLGFSAFTPSQIECAVEILAQAFAEITVARLQDKPARVRAGAR